METPYIDRNIATGLEKSSADDKGSNYGNYRAHDGGYCYSKPIRKTGLDHREDV